MRNNRETNSANKKWLWIGIPSAVLVLGAGAAGYMYWSSQQREEAAAETAHAFVETLENQEYDQLAALVSSSSLEALDYTQEEVAERYDTIYGGIGAADVTAENVEVTENEETDQFVLGYDLHMTTSLGELSPQTYEAVLEETDDGFAINWAPDLIFPEMEAGDTVRISLQSGERGSILDRNGELLAGEGPAWQAGLYPAALGEGEERNEALQEIAETFQVSVEQLDNLLSAGWVTEESFVPFTLVEEGDTPEVKGVRYQQTTARTYPLGEAGAHLIGYVGEVFAEDIENDPTLQPGDIIGKSGLEAAFNERLRGGKGGEISIQTGEGEVKSVLQEAPVENGEDITLTIDSNLQRTYFDGFDGQSGAAVVTEPGSGELLVLTSSPSYDPTAMARGISQEEYQAYANDEAAPFLPRYTARYAPASTFKVLTAAIGLESGATTLDESHTITGYTWQKDDSWGDYSVTRVSDQPTEVDLEAALVYSDNIFFAQEAVEMGAETYMTGLNQFPFGEEFDVPLSMQPAQITNSGEFDTEMLMADTAYGQGQLLMSPLHQAIFYSPFANSGELVFPKLEMTETPAETTQPISPETAETVENMLVQVVETPGGTGHGLNDLPGTVAAKTGTGEVQAQNAEDGNDINGFLLAFDAADHRFLSLIMTEDVWGNDVVDMFRPVLAETME